MRLYHGSNTDIKEINLALCRPYKDFGQGFYLTEIKEQAEKMANKEGDVELARFVAERKSGFERISP
uniref:DUF3990 domain-containing protein n=1 Tax=Eubacterium cellulosolvens TaxID=29322 RepID=UPI000555E7E2|nr:DUF3990 domain-containing protein [[Eubacterium] cellulosolvens]